MRTPAIAIAIFLAALPAADAQPPAAPDGSGLYLSAAAPTGGAGGRLTTAAITIPATTLTTDITLDVVGMVAHVSVRQRFRNDSPDWVEGTYVFPLPDGAAVNELVMEIGDRRIEGEIQEREQARQTYQKAREAGQQASLVEQQRSNLFTTSVANIAPGQEIAIEIGFLETVNYENGQFSLRLPMTLTPRFNTPSVSDAVRIASPIVRRPTPGSHEASIAVRIDAGMPLAEFGSPSHSLTSSWDGRRYQLTTGRKRVPMDRDFVLQWRIVPDQTPRVTTFTETRDGDTYLLLMFMPPTVADLPTALPRELIFVVDTSGSMEGHSIARARTALQSGLGRLRPGDRFNLIEFNSTARALFKAPVPWTTQSENQARRFVSGLRANGGTNIAAALTLALDQGPANGSLRQIVFLTDGSVGNEADLFAQIHDDLGDARLFTIGIGSAPNAYFMRKAAQFGRGSYLPIADAAEVEPTLVRLFDELEHVALRDIELDWPAGFEVYPERVPDLYRGEPVVVAARMQGAPPQRLAIKASGNANGAPWTQSINVMPASVAGVPSPRSGGIATIWARRKIESLLDSRLEGNDENTIRQGVVAVALTHHLLSEFTSLVAVDLTPERTRDALLRREALGNRLPAGSTMGERFASLPATATSSRWYQLLGIVLAALVIGLAGIWRLTRRLD